MAFFLVEKKESSGGTRVEGVTAMVVEAYDEDLALQAAQARFDGDTSWADANVYQLVSSGSGIEGWMYEVRIAGSTKGSLDETVVSEVAGVGETEWDVGPRLRDKLNAIYGAGTFTFQDVFGVATLTKASGGELGDRQFSMKAKPSWAAGNVPDMVGPITDPGVPADPISIQFAPSTARPIIWLEK